LKFSIKAVVFKVKKDRLKKWQAFSISLLIRSSRLFYCKNSQKTLKLAVGYEQ
jgi:hypothetical protein